MEKMRNILITIAYDGKDFHGWQVQPALPTVQGEIQKALTALVGYPVAIDGTGRTDAGVHALGQCATFQLREEGIPTERLAFALTNRLPGSIAIRRAEEVLPGSHARFSCVGKTYRYRIVAGKEQDLFLREYCHQIGQGLDTAAMKEAASYMEGYHDFAAFQAAGGEERATTFRTVFRVNLIEKEFAGSLFATAETDVSSPGESIGLATPPSLVDDIGLADARIRGESIDMADAPSRLIDIEVTGDGFLYNMVRIMAGTLVEVGQGRIAPSEIPRIIAQGDRQKAGYTAPPQGLYLKKVYFKEGELHD